MALLQAGTDTGNQAPPIASFEAELEALHDDEGDAESAVELLEDAARWKVPVNVASREALRELPGLSERELTQIFAYRAAAGPITGLDDLIAAGLSEEAAAALSPFLSFSERPDAPRPPLRIDFLQRWSRRLDLGRGYHMDGSSGYLGSPAAVQSRLNVRLGRSIFAGIVLDKDAGEPFFWSPRRGRYGADFASMHVGTDGAGPLERLIVGDFSVRSAEGLLLGQGMSGLAALRVASTGRLLRPHTSSRESGYFRGLAFQTRPVRGASLAAFISSQALDGRRDSADGSWRIVAPGGHRTGTELDGRRLIRSLAGGAVLSWSSGPLHVGVQAVQSRFGLEEAIRTVSSLSLFGGWIRPGWALTTEVVPERAQGSLAATFAPVPDAVLAVRARRTSAGSERPHSHVGVDSRGTSIETRAWEAECGFRPFAAWSARFRLRGLASGDALYGVRTSKRANVLLQYKPESWLSLELGGMARTSEEAAACEAGRLLLRCGARRVRQSLRLQLEYRHSASLRSRSRLELVRDSMNEPPGGEPRNDPVGLLLYEDVRWRAGRSVQIDVRFAVFETSDESARVYAFENDVLYAFSAPSFAGRGRRWYVLARADPFSRLSLQLKLGVTVYEDVTSVGSGLNEVAGRRIREMKLQIRWRLDR